ncbi:MAG: hypothetical protein P8174_07155 [Gemmatimonadota bacterium]
MYPLGTIVVTPEIGGVFLWPSSQGMQLAGLHVTVGAPWRLEVGGAFEVRLTGMTFDHTAATAEFGRVLFGASTASRVTAILDVSTWRGNSAVMIGLRGAGAPELDLGKSRDAPAFQAWADLRVGLESRPGAHPATRGIFLIQLVVALPVEFDRR